MRVRDGHNFCHVGGQAVEMDEADGFVLVPITAAKVVVSMLPSTLLQSTKQVLLRNLNGVRRRDMANRRQDYLVPGPNRRSLKRCNEDNN